MGGLAKNKRIEIFYISTKQKFDCSQLVQFDIILFYDIRKAIYENVDKIKGVSIARTPDSHDINEQWIEKCKSLNIKHCFNHQSAKYARKFLPNDILYHQVIFGITEELHSSPNFDNRIRDKILLPGISNNSKFYILRERCRRLSYIEHVSFEQGYVNNRFPILLSKYRAAIAACTVCSVYKYFELPACGCLTFMEVNSENGCDELGYIDGVHSVHINMDNYIEKFKQYLQDVDNPQWKKIAAAGRRFTIENYSNKVQIQKFVDIMESLV